MVTIRSQQIFIAFFLLVFVSCHQPEKRPLLTNDVIPADTTRINRPDSNTIEKQMLPEQLITPGQGIGNLAIAQNVDSVISLLGKPDSSDAAMGSSLMVWYAKHDPTGNKTSIFAHRNMGGKDENISRVKKIMVTSPWFKTTDGLSAGAALTDIEKYYSLKPVADVAVRQKKLKVYDDVERGISFDIDNATGKCVAITVYAPKDSSGTYLNMH